MLRSILIYLSQAAWAKRLVMGVGIARRVAKRFVAGETLEEGIAAVAAINQQGMYATMDQLGEHTETAEQAANTTDQILKILDQIHSSGVKSGLSVKLTQIGLGMDDTLCAENLILILTSARDKGIFVRIDMEDYTCLEPTLGLYWKMRNQYGFDNLGMVIQSYLYRSGDDVAALLQSDTTIRLVKGAYKEPPEVAYPHKKDVDAAFDQITAQLLDHARREDSPPVSEDGRCPPVTALGTHDEARINFGIQYAEQYGIPKEKLEIQMLYGIRRDLQRQLTNQGYPVRIYVPFGTEWYPYFMRRLAERPANLWFFISSLFRK
ncbi:MAG: proline dehydrogenase family protein [Anaerolineales bacterium]|nr:proline dehydrogenase family protein [Anaerolineales bacterium]